MIEDDVYGDLYEGTGVRLAQIDGLRHVIFVGSYTKLIGPALRVGFVAADTALIAQLVERKVPFRVVGLSAPGVFRVGGAR